jgi:Skp family chaperone for outer membrane proteins
MKQAILIFIGVLFIIPNIALGNVRRFIRIGYVDVEEIFNNYPGTDDIRERLRQERVKFEEEIEKRKEEIARAERDYLQNFNRFTDEERQRREAEIEYRKETLSEYIDDANKKLEALRETLTSPIYLKIVSVIQSLSEERGYSFVFRKASATLLYQDKEFDLTRDVIVRLRRELQIEERN